MAEPRSVLFVCNLNRVRSPMAAALAERRGLVAESCGLHAADAVDPFLAAVMLELGVDLTEHQPRTLEALQGQTFDLIVALTPEARRRVAQIEAAAVEYWPTEDPTTSTGSRDRRLEAYRDVRNALDRRLAARFGRAST